MHIEGFGFFLKGSVTLKKWKNEIMKKWNYTFVLLQTLKFTLFSKKALYYCIYLWRNLFGWMSLTLQGCQMLATLKNHEIFNCVYSFTPMLMKFLHNTLVISPKETPMLEFLIFLFFKNYEISKFQNLTIFQKSQSCKF